MDSTNTTEGNGKEKHPVLFLCVLVLHVSLLLFQLHVIELFSEVGQELCDVCLASGVGDHVVAGETQLVFPVFTASRHSLLRANPILLVLFPSIPANLPHR